MRWTLTQFCSDRAKNILTDLHKILLHSANIRFTNNHPQKVNTKKDDFYINAVNGNAVIISQNEEHLSMGVFFKGEWLHGCLRDPSPRMRPIHALIIRAAIRDIQPTMKGL